MHRGKAILLSLKTAITISLVAWIGAQADWQSMRVMLAAADGRLVLAAVAAHAFSFVLLNVRWWSLLRYLAPQVRLRETTGSFYLGLFGNNFLPTGMGGDVLKILRMRTRHLSGKSLLASSIMDRAIGLAGVMMIGVSALFLFEPPFLQGFRKGLLLVILIAIPVGFAVFYSDPMARLLERLQARYQGRRLVMEFMLTLGQLQAFRHAGVPITRAMALTLVLQSSVAICYYFLGLSLGSQLGFTTYLIMIPVLFVAANLPISIGGLGVREGVFITLMVASGMQQQTAIGVSVLYLATVLTLTVPGGLVLLRQHRSN